MDKSNKSDLPNNDSDKKLAEIYNKVLTGETDPADVDDPLFQMLTGIRDEDGNQQKDIPVHGKESSWESISQTIQDNDSTDRDSGKRATITPIRPQRQWLKVAAAIVLVACSAILLISQFSSPERIPVAESSTSVQSVELADGSSVTLRPNSMLYELTESENERAYSLSGEGIFNVTSAPDRPFTVEAGSGRVVVTGTRFNLSDRNQTARVFLFEGSVRFETVDGSDYVNLEPGQASEIDETMQVVAPYSFERDIVMSWTQNRLTFRDRQAGSIMNELEFHFNIQISAPENVRSESLGGTIQLDNTEQSLEDLGIVLGGSFEETEDGVFEFRTDGN